MTNMILSTILFNFLQQFFNIVAGVVMPGPYAVKFSQVKSQAVLVAIVKQAIATDQFNFWV
jgi:hypothetical protein